MGNFTFFADFLRHRSGLVIGEEKLYLLETRLARLMREHGAPNLDVFARILATQQNPTLERAVVEAMATHETLFFRDGKPFEHLRVTGLPALLHERLNGRPLRIWSAATATGQEAYSLAMTAAEFGLAEGRRISILGTDLAREPILRARSGLYSQYEVQRGLSVQRLVKHFTRVGEQWQIRPQLMAMCEFREWNLLDDPTPLGMFDVIFCRNVLMYLDLPTRSRVLAALAQQMTPGGLLYLGSTDNMAETDTQFVRHAGATGVFWKVGKTNSAQAIAPRAPTGQTHSTRPSRTPTYQS